MRRSSRVKTLVLSAAILALSTAGIAYAASERYDSSKDNVDKAIALLKAIDHANQPPGERHHRQQAIRQLQGALDSIAKAKAAADRPPPKKDKKDHHHGGKGKKHWKHKKDKKD